MIKMMTRLLNATKEYIWKTLMLFNDLQERVTLIVNKKF